MLPFSDEETEVNPVRCAARREQSQATSDLWRLALSAQADRGSSASSGVLSSQMTLWKHLALTSQCEKNEFKG